MSRSPDKHRPSLPAPAFTLPAAHRSECANFCLEYSLKGEPKQTHKNKEVVVAGRHYGTLFVNHNGWLARWSAPPITKVSSPSTSLTTAANGRGLSQCFPTWLCERHPASLALRLRKIE